MRKFVLSVIILLFLIFSLYIYQREKTFEVLKVFSQSKIAVDFNKNSIIDDNEIIEIKLNIKNFDSQTDEFIYNYLATDFAKKILENQKVKFNKTDLIINNLNYAEIFNNQTFNIEKYRNYRILNLKSNKHHHLNCKYGRQSSEFVLLSKYQLPKNTEECKFCKSETNQTFSKTPNQNLTADTGEIKLFVTNFTLKSKPDKKCSTDLCRNLKNEINNAQNSIDIALYGYGDVPEITKAISDAIKRGVKIRLVYDLDSKKQNYYTDTDSLVSLIKSTNADNVNKNFSSQLMHNKFFIIDKKTVITGSANISPTDMSGFNTNAVVIIKSEKIAEIYQKEFEQMYRGKFHNDKSIIQKPDKIQLGNSNISVYFSPKDKTISNKIIPLINNSTKTIFIPAFVITHKPLVNALISASKRGVNIKVILDATSANNYHSQHELLRKNNIPVKTENFAGKMHSKSIIIDNKYVILGSMNFSNSGENKNDENIIIIENAGLAQIYANFFNNIWQLIPEKWLYLNARAESPDSIGSCTDGIDNDFDGLIDKEDNSCKDIR